MRRHNRRYMRKMIDSVASGLAPALRHLFLLAVGAKLKVAAGNHPGSFLTDALVHNVIDNALRDLQVVA